MGRREGWETVDITALHRFNEIVKKLKNSKKLVKNRPNQHN